MFEIIADIIKSSNHQLSFKKSYLQIIFLTISNISALSNNGNTFYRLKIVFAWWAKMERKCKFLYVHC